jgi:short-subunit dehydrogenase involved in D-alanine esterification of teichoic acids
VTRLQDRTSILKEIIKRFGKLTILVNNAETFIKRDFSAAQDTDSGGMKLLKVLISFHSIKSLNLSRESQKFLSCGIHSGSLVA